MKYTEKIRKLEEKGITTKLLPCKTFFPRYRIML